MLDLISIGAQIAEHRKKLKLSQTVLARKAGISRATLDMPSKTDVPESWVSQNSPSSLPRSALS